MNNSLSRSRPPRHEGEAAHLSTAAGSKHTAGKPPSYMITLLQAQRTHLNGQTVALLHRVRHKVAVQVGNHAVYRVAVEQQVGLQVLGRTGTLSLQSETRCSWAGRDWTAGVPARLQQEALEAYREAP